jgi:hypothetical protein
VLVLAAAHAGGYLLLTAQARKEKRGIEERVGPELETAVQPEPVAPGNAAAYRGYLKAVDLWKDRRRRDELAARTSMFATWFFGALAAELVLGGIGVLKVATASRERPVRRP